MALKIVQIITLLMRANMSKPKHLLNQRFESSQLQQRMPQIYSKWQLEEWERLILCFNSLLELINLYLRAKVIDRAHKLPITTFRANITNSRNITCVCYMTNLEALMKPLVLMMTMELPPFNWIQWSLS